MALTAGGTSMIHHHAKMNFLYCKKSLKGIFQAMGLDPGLEFKVAMEEGKRIGAQVVYGDQPIHETMSKLSSAMNAMDLIKMFASPFLKSPPAEVMDVFKNMKNIESMLEGMKQRNVVRSMQTWTEEQHPNLVQVLVHERDQYMFEQLRQMKGRIVAVVGLGHLDGIERRWEKAESGMD